MLHSLIYDYWLALSRNIYNIPVENVLSTHITAVNYWIDKSTET